LPDLPCKLECGILETRLSWLDQFVQQTRSLKMTTRRVILILVALALVLAASASAAVAAPQASYTCTAYHTVRFGETLNSISRLYGVSVQALMAANNIYNPNLIYAGQTQHTGGAPAPVPPGLPAACTTPCRATR
jgi:LysM repeat protein